MKVFHMLALPLVREVEISSDRVEALYILVLTAQAIPQIS